MPFNEAIKKEVKEKAAFKCCMCQSIGVHIHHIIPEEDGGPSVIENAAPLCPSCHDKFGANRAKQKEITLMRDWWFKTVEKTFPDNSQNYNLLSEINSKVEHLQLGANEGKTSIEDLKSSLRTLSETVINNMTAGTAVMTASSLSSLASISPSPSPSPSFAPPGSESELDSSYCPNCQNLLYFVPATGLCPHCGNIVVKNPFSKN